MGSINPSPSVTGFCTGKGVSISISSAASLQRAKGLITECFNETNGECINKELQSIVPETAVPQDLIKTACSLKVDICIASSVQSSESSDVGHDLPPNVYLPVTYANRNAGLTGNLVTDGASATDLKPSDSLHPAKDIPEACAHEPVLSSGSTRIRPCQASQSLPCSESLGSLKSTGFQTGKGVSISVKSKEALIRAKNLFADSLDEPVGPLDKRTVHKSSHNTLLTLKESQLLPERSKASFVTGFLEGKAGSNALTTKRLCRPKSLVGDSRIEPVGVQTTAPIHPYTSLKADVKNPAPFKDQPLPDASPASIITGFSTGKGTPISLASTEVPKRVRDLLKGCLNDPLLDWCQKPIENCITPLAKNVLEMPSQTNDVHRSDVFSTHNQITVHYMDAALPSDFKSNLISQNARKFTSVLPLNASPQGPTSSAVFCAEVVGTDSSADHGSTSNAKIYLQAEPTAPSADACALPSSSCFPPEEQTDGEIPRKPQSPRFDCGEPLASVFETNSLADTNHASSPRNVTPSKSIKNRALARNLQETMAIAKFKSHATPSPKAARSHADDRTLLASSVAASRGQPHKIVREPISPGLLWRLRHRLSISSTLLNTCCLPEQVSPLNEGFVLPDCLELPKEVSSWSLSTARRLLFRLDTSNSEEFPLSYNLGDGVEVIPNDSGLAGVEEVGRAFVCSPGVTAGLASRTWVNHHFTQLAWRFGSCAILQPNRLRDSLAKFPVDAQSTVEPGGSNLLGCWLLHALLLELKYRYDKELEAVERSALRKILETDDTPAKRMVLCVSQLQPLQNSMYRGRLTDGWYHMDWLPDKALAQLISSGRIRVGTKLVCAGAEAVQRPAGLDPQDSGNTDVQKDVDSHLFGASSGLILRLGANSTRMAHPTARLGYVPTSPNHITSLCPIPLSSLHADGGPVSSILVLVQRRFQLQFMETRSEDSENERKHRIFRDPRSEEAASREHERNCQVAFDKAAGDFSSSPKLIRKCGTFLKCFCFSTHEYLPSVSLF
uniref:BRCA2 OB1 domain-containing protein n=2 Tax=Schistocephalus solidus TaxID=70667 RepID=A0A0V0J7G0_SCHSO